MLSLSSRRLNHILAAVLIMIVTSDTDAQEPRTEPLVLREGGTPGKPAVFDGKGMVIDLGTDISGIEWTKNGDVWTSKEPVEGLPPRLDTQRAALFLDVIPIRIVRDRAEENKRGLTDKPLFVAPNKLKPGQMGWTEEGLVYFRWPAGVAPGSKPVIKPPEKLQSCVVIACSYITVKNITAIHAANDGFNIHGDRVGIRLENVRAIANGDEGISAHETVQMDVENAEIAWNGSSAGGVADVNDSVTTYTNCVLHHNLGAAFYFDGKSHRATDCVIHDQAKDIAIPNQETQVVTERVVWRK